MTSHTCIECWIGIIFLIGIIVLIFSFLVIAMHILNKIKEKKNYDPIEYSKKRRVKI